MLFARALIEPFARAFTHAHAKKPAKLLHFFQIHKYFGKKNAKIVHFFFFTQKKGAPKRPFRD